MTNEQAAAEAVKRWGENSAVYFASPKIVDEFSYSVYSDFRSSMEEGHGRTWEEAFADADRKGKK